MKFGDRQAAIFIFVRLFIHISWSAMKWEVGRGKRKGWSLVLSGQDRGKTLE